MKKLRVKIDTFLELMNQPTKVKGTIGGVSDDPTHNFLPILFKFNSGSLGDYDIIEVSVVTRFHGVDVEVLRIYERSQYDDLRDQIALTKTIIVGTDKVWNSKTSEL